MNKKKYNIIIFILILFFSCNKEEELFRLETIKIAICFDNENDFYLQLKKKLEREYKSLIDNKYFFSYDIFNAKGSQHEQNKNFNNIILGDYDIVFIRLLDEKYADSFSRVAQKKDIPIIFMENKPFRRDYSIYEKSYYLGSSIPSIALAKLNLLNLFYRNNLDQLDKNKDGIIQYVNIRRDRKDYHLVQNFFDNYILNRTIKSEELANKYVNPDNAYNITGNIIENWLKEFPNIELFLIDDTDMILGTISTLKKYNLLKGANAIPILGISKSEKIIKALRYKQIAGFICLDFDSYLENMTNLIFKTVLNKKILRIDNNRKIEVKYRLIIGASDRI